jgi:hypothetical protein
MKTTIEKQKLLNILTDNRTKHQTAFAEALEGYRKAAIAELEKALEAARHGDFYFERLHLIRPLNYTGAYDRAIRMLELNIDNEIELEESQFENLVLDKWNWSRQFAATNKAYAISGATVKYFDSIEQG